MEYLTLHNGRRMPALGLGTWDLRGQTCVETIPRALELGYRLIDTAQMYENEREVGQGLRLAGLPREEVWVTTKIFRPDTTYAKAKAAIQRSLDQLALDYIDLLLIHEPYDTAEEMYVALEEAYQAGTLRAIGISNFHEARYQTFLAGCQVVPMVNQVETHALFQQAAAHEVMAKYGVVHESWGPFAEGRKDFFTNPTLQAIGAKYGKSVAQTALRFLIQSDVVVIPKSTHKERMAENLDVFDFQLSQEDMVAIRALDDGQSAFFSHYDPATVEFLTSLGR